MIPIEKVGQKEAVESEAPAGETSPSVNVKRVVVTAVRESGLEADMDPRFGRAPWFVLVDLESGEVKEVIANTSLTAAHGAGTGAAALVSSHGADAVISGRFGPKARQALLAMGLSLWTAPDGLTVGQVVARMRSNALKQEA